LYTYIFYLFISFMLSRFGFFVGLGRNDKRLLVGGTCGIEDGAHTGGDGARSEGNGADDSDCAATLSNPGAN
jgi:hypothetical protein